MSKAVSEDIGIARLYLAKMQSTQSRGIEFNLTFNQYKALRKRKTCYYTGERLVPINGVGAHPLNGFTLDRIDSSKGYTPENTVACSVLFNSFKNEFEKGRADYETIQLMLKGLTKLVSVIDKDTYRKPKTGANLNDSNTGV